MTLFDRSAKELQALVHSKEVSLVDLTNEAFERVEKLDGEVEAFLALNKEKALATATELEKVPFEERGPLFGLPIGVKDNIVTEGLETTCASKILQGFNPIYDATVVKKLREAGLCIFFFAYGWKVLIGFTVSFIRNITLFLQQPHY